MSSKIYRQGAGRRVEAITWGCVGSPAGSEDPPGAALAAGGSGGNELRRLEARLAVAQQETRKRVEEARQAAFREGETAGQQRAVAEWQAAMERLAASIREMAALRPRLRRDAESDLVRLSVAIARRILHRELTIDPEALRGVIQAAFDRLDSREVRRVRIHSGHEALLRACLERLRPAAGIEVQADPALEPGAAVFETARGDLDVSIEAQLEEIERGLVDRLRGQR